MAADRPPWRRAFDAVERRVAGPTEVVVRSEVFADALSVALRLRRRLERETERRTRRLLHGANLPAASDVKRVSDQVSRLEREVRALTRELEVERARPRGRSR